MVMRWRVRLSWQQCALAAPCALLAVLVVLSNGHDWDHFLTGFEVDLRSWLIDRTPPRWSYQLCGGVTRSGDPQAFGLSPLFVFALLFGSFWGVKALVLAAVVAGYFFHKQLLLLLARRLWPAPSDASVFELVAAALSLLFVTSNYFIWHLHVGQVTFALHYLALGLCYLAAKALLEGLRWRDGLLGAVLLWAYASAGWYVSLFFFVLPLSLCALAIGIGYGVWLAARDRAALGVLLRRSGQLLALIAGGLALGAYKWLPLLEYQLRVPRSFDGAVPERGSVLVALAMQFVPLYGDRPPGWAMSTAADGSRWSYGVWECSSFSLLAWGAVAAAVLLGWRALRRPRVAVALPDPHRRWWMAFLLLYLTIVLLFMLGESFALAPHALLNRLLGGSVRAIGRYGVGLTFACSLLGLYLGRLLCEQRPRLLVGALWLGVALCGVNLGLHLGNASVADFLRIQRLPQQPLARMRLLVQTFPYDGRSYMYPAVLKGAAVLNCYDPLARPKLMALELGTLDPLRQHAVPLLAGDLKALDRRCVEGSHFTQSTLHLDPACPAGTCVNLNALDDDAAQRLRWNLEQQRWCLAP
ncbi:MAG: hypothetical protein JXR83_00105 [Deltaproteobacteria bacterium]|nr:hypothetical protein [Deltaproteobacteria bacterium]